MGSCQSADRVRTRRGTARRGIRRKGRSLTSGDNDMKPLEGKVAFLTGAGRGLGVGIAVALAKAGASVGLFGRKREALEETAAKMAEVGGRSLICLGDVRNRADIDAAVAATNEGLGPIWALVTNAYAADDRK
ncbi:MAG: SDR family NAD(P)-dependent oxidoreductase, partial [Sphingomonadales bacterium]